MNKSKAKQPTNPVLRQDERNLEQLRQAVIEQELSARSWKAFYDKMFYSMECEKLEPEYVKYQERVAERMKKQREEFLAAQKKRAEETPTMDSLQKGTEGEDGAKIVTMEQEPAVLSVESVSEEEEIPHRD